MGRRHRREALAVEEQDAAFALLAANEPAQCYRRLICDLATGGLEKSENDVIVNLFKKDASIESAKFEFVTAAKIGKKHKSIRFSKKRCFKLFHVRHYQKLLFVCEWR